MRGPSLISARFHAKVGRFLPASARGVDLGLLDLATRAPTEFDSFPPAGFYLVGWGTSPDKLFADLTEFAAEKDTEKLLEASKDDPTVTAIYQKNGLPTYVGGVVLPTNTYMTLAPYLALVGLVATAAVAVKKRRN